MVIKSWNTMKLQSTKGDRGMSEFQEERRRAIQEKRAKANEALLALTENGAEASKLAIAAITTALIDAEWVERALIEAEAERDLARITGQILTQEAIQDYQREVQVRWDKHLGGPRG